MDKMGKSFGDSEYFAMKFLDQPETFLVSPDTYQHIPRIPAERKT